MATTLMSFPKRVRYKHIQYPPNTAFEVDDKDVAGLKLAGGWVIEKPKKVEEPKKVEKPKVETKPKAPAKKAKGASKKKEG